MTILIGGLVGLGIGEVVYLLNFLGGGFTPLVVQYLYGPFVIVPFRLDTTFKLNLNWNLLLMLYYGINGLLGGAIFKFKMKSKLLNMLFIVGLFIAQLMLALVVL